MFLRVSLFAATIIIARHAFPHHPLSVSKRKRFDTLRHVHFNMLFARGGIVCGRYQSHPTILPDTKTELTSKAQISELKQSYEFHWDHRFEKTYSTYSSTIIKSPITFAIPATERTIKRVKKRRGAPFELRKKPKTVVDTTDFDAYPFG